jgi:long-chain acyl-CoA synthetase
MNARAAGPTVRAVNLAADLAATAARIGGKTALRHGDAAMSYRALDASSARLAALLAGRGVAPGDRVGVLLPDVPALAVVVYGVLRAGAVVVLLEAADLATWAAIGDASLLVAWHALAERAEDAAARAGIGCLFVTPGEFERLLRSFPADHVVRERRDADVAVVWRGGALTHGELRLRAPDDG